MPWLPFVANPGFLLSPCWLDEVAGPYSVDISLTPAGIATLALEEMYAVSAKEHRARKTFS